LSKEKAYKLLAIQEGISNNEAKSLIDSGLVYAHGKKILIARGLLDSKATFKVLKVSKPKVIFQDEKILAVNKPAFMPSAKIEEMYNYPLLNRLDKETSGVILLAKNEEFKEKAIKEYKNLNVVKRYFAMVRGIVTEEMVLDENILTIKGKGEAFSKVSQSGKTAVTKVTPFMVSGKRSIVKVEIKTGRTHQIRVHLAHAGFPVIGDEKYGGNVAKRLFLHSFETEILGYKFTTPLDRSFNEYGFEIA